MGPCDLDELVKKLNIKGHPDLLVGPEHGSDAGVYKLSDEMAIVQSADFFPPMIADAKAFGMVAAANAMSDIYAMGGRPVTALNLLATPNDTPQEALVAMLDGAQEVVTDGGAVICGGHTIVSKTIMFGLSVTGVVHPDKLLRNVDARAGDVLVLTKPLGSGITVHGYNAGAAGEDKLAACIEVMAGLNRIPAELMLEHGAHSATDITGFGLLGHALDMLSLGQVGFEIDYPSVPQLAGAEQLALGGNLPAGSMRNAEYTEDRVDFDGGNVGARLVLNDAQTSGGLLIAMPVAGAMKLLEGLESAGYPFAANIIGRVAAGHPGRIRVNCP